ncbi:MAG: ATP-dependent RNA helicase HrpA [Gammaproteobacteria bacterium]
MPTPSGRARDPAAVSKLRLEYDPGLPISAHRAEILEALARHQVIIVCGATGSGKTTQLPKLCLEAGRGMTGLIGHTQPRRLAARALATRLAEEVGTTVGAAVGYQVRFNDHTGPNTLVKLMTDGILLKELESDRLLRKYDTLIIDEAHERSLNIDLIFGVLKQLLPKRPDLKVIVTSATIDPGKFSSFFGGAPIIEVSGRSYPVEVRYRPLVAEDAAEDEDATELSLPEGIVQAVRELDKVRGLHGDTLVFLPGEKQIREAAEALEAAEFRNTQVLALYSRLSARDQMRIFERHVERRIVLATNVAETSLTVPGVRFVIDSGLARVSRYSVRGKVQRLPIEGISKASAEQRKGRCGREAQGICIRLYSEENYALREEFTPPEVLRTNLASVILRMATLGLGEPENFPFLDAPDTRMVNDGVRLLQELKAMDEDRRVTSLGAQIAGLPVDPRLGRMLLAASRNACLTEMLIIAAFLEAQDPRERPQDAQQHATEKHAAFADKRSDFITVLNLWRTYGEQSAALSRNQLRKWCRENFLSFMRMREWQDLHTQLSASISELKLRPNQVAAGYAELHQAILTGFLGSIGNLDERREYDGPRAMRFVIAPGTPLASRPPKWVVAASLIETARLYARMVAAVDPGWIESAGSHLLKRHYTEPQWVVERGFVSAFETVTLYGLTLAARRRVNYGAIAPAGAREIFVREALVAGHGEVHGDFLPANRKLIAEVERLEAKIRRRDILVDEQGLVNFYISRIPERMSTLAAFESWRIKAVRHNPALLYMRLADLMQREAPEASGHQFPDELPVHGNHLPLLYKFEPAEADDGITVIVPEPLIDMLDAGRLAWLVPGLRLEKITAMLRALPKQIRKQFVPVPDAAKAMLASVELSSYEDLPDLYQWFGQQVSSRAGEPVDRATLEALVLPDYLRMNIRVLDARDEIIAEGRDLQALKRRLRAMAHVDSSGASAWGAGDASPEGGPRAESGVNAGTPGSRAIASNAMPATRAPNEHRQWDFGDLPEHIDVERNRLRFRIYPAIEDHLTFVTRIEVRSAPEAEVISRAGLTRLALLTLPSQTKFITQRISDNRELILLSSGLPLASPLPQSIAWRAARECFLPDEAPLPRTESAFVNVLEARRGELSEVADRLAASILETLKEWRTVRLALDRLRTPAYSAAVADIAAQLATLLPPNFIESTPHPWLERLPRYLKAIRRRIERLTDNVARDAELAARVAPFAVAVANLRAEFTNTRSHPELDQLRWMIEEFCVSLHAQEIKTQLRVSEKRLAEQLERVRTEARG